MSKFQYVDFAAHFQKGFRNRVVAIREIPALVKSFDSYGCYSTYFFYSDEIISYMEAHRMTEDKASVSGYEGKVWAPEFPIDIDHVDRLISLEAARYLVSFFLDGWKVDPNGLQIYFSGCKGFHLMLDARMFGKIVPAKSVPLLFAALRRHLVKELPVSYQQTIDLSIKDRVRLLRLPNTLHEKSGRYKILLSVEELRSLGFAEIEALAGQPRALSVTDETGLIPCFEVAENEAAGQFFRRIKRQIRQLTHKSFEYHFRRPQDLSKIVFPCAGVQAIWQNHIEPGYRNNCAFRLASELRLMGLTQAETHAKLSEWNEINQIELPGYELDKVVASAYQHEFPYHYRCGDEILRRFCPLPSLEACRAYVARHSGKSS